MNILDELISDHRRLYEMLALFEHELQAFDTDEAADLQLMQDIASYYAEYFNHFHHPLEDCLFERLLSHESQKKASAHSATNEHDALRIATGKLLVALDRALHDTMVTRVELVESSLRFLQQNRDHMQHEESGPFKQAQQCLTADDWRTVEIDAETLRNRVDMESVRRQYDTILMALRTMQPAISK